MDNTHISNNTKKIKVSHATINDDYGEKVLNAIFKNFKAENDSHFHDTSSDSEDATSMANPVSSPSTALPKISCENKKSDSEIIVRNTKDSNCEMVPDSETKSDSNEQSHINTSITEEKFNNYKLSTFEMVSNVHNRSDHEIILDIDEVSETASRSKKGTINYKIMSFDDILHNIKAENDSNFHDTSSDSEDATSIVNHSSSPSTAFPKIYRSCENKKSDSEILVRNTNNLLELFSETASWSKKGTINYKIMSFDDILHNIKAENDSNFHDTSSDSEDATSIVNPSSSPSTALPKISCENKKSDSEIIVRNTKDSNCEMVPDSETKSDSNEQSHINTSITEEKFNNYKLSTFEMVSNVHNRSDHEILLDIDEVSETASWNKKGTINYKIMSFDDILHNIKAENDSNFHDTLSDSEDATSIVNPSSSLSTAFPKISCENNSTDDNTTKSYRNRNIACASPLQLKSTSKKIPYFHNREKSSRKSCIKNVLLDKYISDSAGLSDSGSLSDSIILSDSEIIVRNTNNLLDSEIFSETDSEEIFPVCEIKETDFLTIGSDDDLGLDSNCELKTNPYREIEMSYKFVSDSEKSLDGKIILNSVKDSNCEMVPDAETKSDNNELSHINTSITEEEFNNNKLSTFEMVSNVQNRSDHEILLDIDEVSETASWSEKGTINYKIMSFDEIKPSGYKGFTCIIISDNDNEFHNTKFSTYKINVLKGSNNKILLDGEKVKIVSETENIEEVKYEIEPFENKKSNKCIIILDDENDLINKNLSTFKIVSNVKKESDCEMLLDGEKVYEIDSENEKYIILSKDEIKSSANPRSSIMLSNNKNKFNNKKSTFKILVKNVQKRSQSENEEIQYYNKVSDIKFTPNGEIILYDSLGLKTLDDNNTINNDSQLQIKHSLNSFPFLELTVNQDGDTKQDTTQEYFEQYYSAIKYYFENTESQSQKELYSRIGNVEDMLLYLMENLRMFYCEELATSKTADKFSKDYLKEQKTVLINCFGDPKDSINASKPFIHSSSHLHQYSKRLTPNIEPLVIQEITNTTRSNAITSPKNNVAFKSKFNNIRTSKLLPLCNSVKSRLIPNLSDDNQTFPHFKTYNFQLPAAIKRKTDKKSKVLLPQTCKLKK